jgi:hypothetical protein
MCGRAGDGVAASPWASVRCGWQLVEAVAVRPDAAVSFNTRAGGAGGGLAANLLFPRPLLAQLVGVASPFGGELEEQGAATGVFGLFGGASAFVRVLVVETSERHGS